MADKAPTLSQALNDHMNASGETLEQVNQRAFLAADLQGGMGYLELVVKHRVDDMLYAPHTSEGTKLLAQYLASNRARLGLPVNIIPPAPPRSGMLQDGKTAPASPVATTPIRRHIRKPRPPRSRDI